MKIFIIKNLAYKFLDGTYGIKEINLEIYQNEFIIIAGENGSGKTTLIKHLNGLLTPSYGFISFYDKLISKCLYQVRQHVGMVFQDADSQIVGETVYEDVAFGPQNMSLKKSEIEKRTLKALKITNLINLAEKKTYMLSGGEKRRVAIAGVLAMNPEVIIFDEPFANLDWTSIKQITNQINLLHKLGKTIIISTHDLEKIIFYATRLIIMSKGKIIKDGEPFELIKTVDIEQFGIKKLCNCFSISNPRKYLINILK